MVGSVTNNTTRVRIGYRIYSLWRFTAATQDTIEMSTLALLASWILLTELHCTDVSLRGLTAKTDFGGRLTLLSVVVHYLTLGRPDRKHWPSYCWLLLRTTLTFLLLVAMVTNNTGVVSVSLPTVEESRVCMGVFNLRLPSNDSLQSNTSHYVM
jgi:hypothetical protein